MFRCVSHNVEKPVYWMVCDNRNCGFAARGDADTSSQETVFATQQAFLAALQADGWLIGLDAQMCPDHAAALRATLPKKEQSLVQIADGRLAQGLRGSSAEEKIRKHGHGNDHAR